MSDKEITDLTGIEGFTALTLLRCYNNKFTSLDFSKNKKLTILICEINKLTRLDVRNGKNNILNQPNFKNNPGLICILVDDKAYSDANWSGKKDKDATAKYVENPADCK